MSNFINRRKILKELVSNIDENKLNKILETEEYKLYNAMITAEGAIKIALENCEMGIALTDVILIGYGRIGKPLAKMLTGMNANLTIVEKDKTEIMNAKVLGYNIFSNCNMKNANIIFNTVEDYSFQETDAIIIDLATQKNQKDIEKIKKIDDLKTKKTNEPKIVTASALPEKIGARKAALYISEYL
ncbi:MAG: hypothetical protein FWF50_04495 [Defluviitaleaceae bacterium]|nr:hypothetical protein [Defluviitaleaceae bacterium]